VIYKKALCTIPYESGHYLSHSQQTKWAQVRGKHSTWNE